ncbi:unnamed protein product [Paramecium pentaurelia]|uniref:Ankyrin repeat protein n=1 Tax=Paramecium pentaurelia TaxID=43138 RepID=A0A8S1U208_9CILI|nr:unnamed protein product [Paramecium pentaurelia]
MNNIDFLIKQQTIYTIKQKEFFKKKKLQVEIDDFPQCQVQVVTSPNQSTKYILQMQEADIKQITKSLQNQYMIEILELKECRLKTVPDEIFKMQKLRVLKLEGNFIKVAPVIDVEVLSLKNNLLLHYKAGEKVKVLDLSQNKLQEFNFGNQLEELYIIANEFTILPQLPQSIKKLELDWFKYTEPPLNQIQTQPTINLLTNQSVNCIDFLKMFSQKELQNKIIEASLAQDLGVLSSLAAIMDINIQNENGDTALSLSLKTDNLFSVRHLIELGAQLELGSYPQGNILSFSLENNLPTIINLIFPKLNSSLFTYDVYGNSPLHYLNKCDYDDINAKIIMKAKQLNIQMSFNIYGQSPIHLAIQKSKNWLLSNMLKHYKIEADDLFMMAARYDNLGAVMLLINNNYPVEEFSKIAICRNLKIYRVLKSYENYNIKKQLTKQMDSKNNFNYEVKLINKKDIQCSNFLKQRKASEDQTIDENQSQSQKSQNYIKLLRQFVLFQTLLSKQQKSYLIKQMIQRICELKITKIDQITILSDILLTLYFIKEKQFLNEVQKNYFNILSGHQYLFQYVNSLKTDDILIQYEQFQY